MEYIVNHYPGIYRFEIEENGLTAYVEYALSDTELDIMHTVVPKLMEGKGVASTLVEATYKYAKEIGLKPQATCSYAVAWLKRHPNF